ncbi:hypothetical protein FDP22_07435 [Paroceanicella profunda]|uniref:Uncharacterized protein n=1 Tax=Paroceanicella profunda TaxID=2579971 RepID=A0A5B8FZF1_9RHOB|nr:hypothetical protein [Paroceanicella profunda]QDL91633.1 hypothetical protein FDP22_07435 [Paroceanicella profunda]
MPEAAPRGKTTDAGIARAIRAAQACGLDVTRIITKPGGVVEVITEKVDESGRRKGKPRGWDDFTGE